MVLSDIEKLIVKYNNCETTLEDEQLLKNYFTQEIVPPHLDMYKPLFGYFLAQKGIQFTKPLQIRSKPFFNYKWIAVAAVTVLMLGTYYRYTQKNDLGTYEDPEIAFTAFSQSMEMISSKFNKGTATVGYLKGVHKGASALGYLNEVNNATRIIFKPAH